jgi:hypothetical protein
MIKAIGPQRMIPRYLVAPLIVMLAEKRREIDLVRPLDPVSRQPTGK